MAPKPKPKRKAPPPPPPGIGERIAAALRASGQTARRSAGLLIAVAIIGLAIWYGARQGREESNAGFDAPTTAQTPAQAPAFQSDQDQARNLSTKDAFAHSCGTCHTLRGAGVKGVIGPDLDRTDRKMTFALVRAQIRTGSIDGAMPSNLLVGKDADRVARYVARVAR
jgi:mono/diheme cytochrome c family protein